MELKFCRLCDSYKEVELFSFHNKSKNIRQTYCKSCQNCRSQQHYRSCKETYLKRIRKRNKENLIKLQRYILEYLSNHPCVDCGESDPVVLEFDHIQDKKYNVSELIKERGNIKRLIEEIKNVSLDVLTVTKEKLLSIFNGQKPR